MHAIESSLFLTPLLGPMRVGRENTLRHSIPQPLLEAREGVCLKLQATLFTSTLVAINTFRSCLQSPKGTNTNVNVFPELLGLRQVGA